MWEKSYIISKCIKYSNYSNNFIVEAKKKQIIGDNYNSYLLRQLERKSIPGFPNSTITTDEKNHQQDAEVHHCLDVRK